jgi:starch synthase
MQFMKILMAASEFAPMAESGELGTSVTELARAMARSGHDVTVVIPYYRSVRENKSLGARKSKIRFSVDLGSSILPCEIWDARGPDDVRLLFVARDEFYDRSGLYGSDGRDYQDNASRFIFFAKCVTELSRTQLPDILHAIGWQSALATVFIKHQGLRISTIFSPSSLSYQGNFWSHDFALTNLPGDYFSAGALEFYGSMNFLKAGIVFADAVVLPGERFLAGALTPLHGCGLENVLHQFSRKLEGIRPGISADTLPCLDTSAKPRNAARKILFPAITADAATRVFVADTASFSGPGLSPLLEVLDRIPSPDFRLLLLGPVEPEHTTSALVAERRHAGRFLHFSEINPAILDKVLLAADYVLSPGPLNPDAAFFLLAMHNGIVPVAEHCPGLSEIIVNFDPSSGGGNGLVFNNPGVNALADVVRRALYLPEGERKILSSRARDLDLSWDACASRLTMLAKRLAGVGAKSAA